MADMMTFPETWEEFEKSYGFTDNEEVYTNGSRLIPSFRVKQWLDHEESKRETKQQATIPSDRINRRDAIKSMANAIWHYPNELYTGLNSYEMSEALAKDGLMFLPSADPGRLTDDDFETIRIHLNAQKEKLCNQQRWEEAEEYQRIIDRFMVFASAERRGEEE